MDFEYPLNIGDFLPKYLSAESFSVILKELEAFPTDGTKDTVFTSLLRDQKIIFQGDGIANLPFYDAQTQNVFENKPGIILSNTCDLDQANKRIEDIHICFAPILNLAKYVQRLELSYSKDKVREHIDKVKRQILTHLVYLPKGGDLEYDAIIPLDRICYVGNSFVDREQLPSNRLFTLSDFGNYLLLLKMSIHFTRIRERVDRNKGEIL